MSQIVQKGNGPVRCNLAAIQSGGSKADEVLNAGEIWLVDTTNASKGDFGFGRYDAFIVGDGTHAASALDVNPIDPADDVPQEGSGKLVKSGGVFDVTHKITEITPLVKVSMGVNNNTGVIQSLSSSYRIAYHEAPIAEKVSITFTRNSSFASDGWVFKLPKIEDLASGSSALPKLKQFNTGTTEKFTTTVNEKEVLCVTYNTSDVVVFSKEIGFEDIVDIQDVEADNEFLWMVVADSSVETRDQGGTEHVVDVRKACLGVRVDGSVFFGSGVPAQIKSYVEGIVSKAAKEDNPVQGAAILNTVLNQPRVHVMDANGKVKYSSYPEYNVERRANQAKGIKWTPLSNVQQASAGVYFEAGTEYHGVPYASAMENDKFIGYDVSFESFMTSVHNPYSLFYTENLKARTSKYGFTYHTARDTVGGYMGMVCNVYALWSIGCDIPWDTGNWRYLIDTGELVKVYDQSAQGVEIGDIIWQSGHGRLIQNVYRNENGVVTSVEFSESKNSTGTGASTEYTYNFEASRFNNFIHSVSEPKIIYRYAHLFKNTDYESMPFAFEGGADTDSYAYNADICAYGGEKSCYREGFKVVLNYDLGDNPSHSWTALELYKDETLVYSKALSEFDQTGYDSTLQGHAINLGTGLEPGMYKARLTDGSNYSGYTNFEVIETNVTFGMIRENSARVSFSSANGKPLFVRFHKINGAPKAIYRLTSEDIENGYCTVDVKGLIDAQGYSSSPEDLYCKVTFEGNYGRVTNDPIDTGLTL